MNGFVPSLGLKSESMAAWTKVVVSSFLAASLATDSDRGPFWPASRVCFLRARLESVVSLISIILN